MGLSTKASVSMVAQSRAPIQDALSRLPGNAQSVMDLDNRSNFCATLAIWRPQ